MRAQEFAGLVVTVAAALLAVRAVWPAPANAADLFPVDDWLSGGLKKAGDVVLGPLKLGVEQIAKLLASIVGALADLLIPKSLVNAGLGGIKWLVQLPPVGADATPAPGVPQVRMPHLHELRDTMTWIGITLLPLGLVISAGRAYLAPTLDGDSPAEVLGRVVTAGIGLVLYEWAWGVVTELSRLLTSGLLGLPWVADGVEKMLQTLVIGGATGSAVAAEFVVPLLIMVAGTVLLGLLLVRVGLEVATALLYVMGGLVLGLSVTSIGRRLLSAWLIAAAAILALPLLWSAVFATGAALMLDAGATGSKGGLESFVAQLYNVAAALAIFWIAIKLALGVFRHASAAMTGIASTPATASGGARGASGGTARGAALAHNATPAGFANFSKNLRGNLRAAASYPARHPVRVAQAASYPLRRPVQATREAAAGLSGAMSAAGGRAAAAGRSARDWYGQERADGHFGGHAANQRADTQHARRNGHAADDAVAREATRSRDRSPAPPPVAAQTRHGRPAARPSTRAAPARPVTPSASMSSSGSASSSSRANAAPDAPVERVGEPQTPPRPDGARPRPDGRPGPSSTSARSGGAAGPRPVWLLRPRAKRDEDKRGKDTR